MATEIKQVIVWRHDLKVRKGKMMAQAAHASMKVLLDLLEWGPESNFHEHSILSATLKVEKVSALYKWLKGTFSKICVYVDSEEDLLKVYQQAKDAGIITALITDNGNTEFHGIPTITCCAIGPDYAEKINVITGHLKLL